MEKKSKEDLFAFTKNKERLGALGGCITTSIIGYLLIAYWAVPTITKLFAAVERHSYQRENYLGILAFAIIYFTVLVFIFFLISFFKELDGGILFCPMLCSVIGLIFGLFVASFIALTIGGGNSINNLTDPTLIFGGILGLTVGFALGFGLGVKQEFG